MAKIDFTNKRILQVGCGLALSSHYLNMRGAEIIATDYHAEVIDFLNENSKLNSVEKIPFTQVGWDDLSSDLGKFNLIIGSDLLYMYDRPKKLAKFLDKHADANSIVIIVDPGREQMNAFIRLMHLYEFNHHGIIPDKTGGLKKPFNGLIHYFDRF